MLARLIGCSRSNLPRCWHGRRGPPGCQWLPRLVRETARNLSPRGAHAPRRSLGLEVAMGFRTILVPIEQHDLMNSTLETALLLARKFDSYIEGFALRVAIPAALAVGDVGAVPIPPSRQEIAENEKRSRTLFEKFMQDHGVPSGGDIKSPS